MSDPQLSPFDLYGISLGTASLIRPVASLTDNEPLVTPLSSYEKQKSVTSTLPFYAQVIVDDNTGSNMAGVLISFFPSFNRSTFKPQSMVITGIETSPYLPIGDEPRPVPAKEPFKGTLTGTPT